MKNPVSLKHQGTIYLAEGSNTELWFKRWMEVTPAAYHAYPPTAPSRYDSDTSTHPYASTHPLCTMLMLPQDPLDTPMTLPPDVGPHPSLHFQTPTACHAYSPETPSRYATKTFT
ncbi:hypothetical protein O181_021974 [Austropuccinia psidii MF-1]|uniref:Uncharacterized protein n=1 Tax=Austropuccinia psidii MF-1 TaxID=1389203 RepID=A0A9Q3GX75_9BASI|nr:hypothetical protein [Austropuccinia psidii MF-1]